MPYLSASEVMIHYEEALYQVYAPLPLLLLLLLLLLVVVVAKTVVVVVVVIVVVMEWV